MRIPDPKANTTTEAYLAYKAGYLEESELKPKLYEPYLHFDAWLAYWAGLTDTYPNNGPSNKNIFDGVYENGLINGNTGEDMPNENAIRSKHFTKVSPNTIYRITVEGYTGNYYIYEYKADMTYNLSINKTSESGEFQTNAGTEFVRFRLQVGFTNKTARTQIEKGSSATEYEPYYAIPDMLTDEEALVAYLSGVTNTYPEEIKDPYDVRIVGYLKHLASIRWPEPDYPVNNEEFYLSTMEPTHTSNSVPSSDIELDTAEGKIISVEAYGDTTQTTYSGKNLFNYQATNKLALGSTVVGPQDSYCGYTLKVNAGETYTISRASTASTNRFRIAFTAVEPASGVNYYNQSGTIGQSYVADTYLSATLTVPSGMEYLFLYLSNSGETITEAMQIQIESGSATDYEPYVGGIPAPNPEYPQPISVVTGENVVKVVGKNLLDIVAGTRTDAGVEYSKGNGTASAIGTSARAAYAQAMNLVGAMISQGNYPNYGTITEEDSLALPSGTYTLSATISNTGNTNGGLFIGVGDVGSRPASGERLSTTGSASITLADGQRLYLSIWYEGTSTNKNVDLTISNIQLELGSQATSYQAYTEQDYPISLTGKNLFNKATSTAGYRIDSNGAPYANASYFISDYIVVQPSTTYAYSRGAAGSGLATIAYYKSDKTFISRTMPTIASSDTSGTVTTPNDAYYARFCDVNEVLDSAQLELGSTATEYAAYSPIELAKIGTYQDRIYKEGEKWYVEKNTFSKTFDGSESWSIQGTRTHTFYSSLPATSMTGICDHFKNIAPSDFDVTEGCYLANSNRFIVSFPSMNSADDLKAWLATNPTKVVCGVASTSSLHTITEITDQSLIDQLDALAGADTYNVKTYIKVTATEHNLPALLKVEAYKY